MVTHYGERSHCTGTSSRRVNGLCPTSGTMAPWDLHQKDEPIERLAWITNGADVRKSQSAIDNWDSLLREGSCIVLLSLRTGGKKPAV